MRRITILVVLALSALAYPLAGGAGPNGGSNGTACVENTQLRAANEVPPTNSNAFGHTQIKIRNDGTIEFKTQIQNPGGETFVAGHIHKAPVGVNGPVVQSLFVGGPTADSHIKQSGEVANAALGAAICASPCTPAVPFEDSSVSARRGEGAAKAVPSRRASVRGRALPNRSSAQVRWRGSDRNRSDGLRLCLDPQQ
jgi:hypothetical protein